MRQSTVDLKRRFKMALALEESNVAQWTRDHTTVKPSHVHQVLDGRTSARLIAIIEDYTARTLKRHGVKAA